MHLGFATHAFALAASLSVGILQIERHHIYPDYLAPFVPTPEPVVEKMLKLADLKPGETLYDLGSGDGRVLFIAAQKFGAKAVGVEISQKLVNATSKRVTELGLQNRIKVIEGNVLDADLSGADVVTLYFLRLSNEKLKPNLIKQLRAGARVVSHDFEIMGWKPDQVEKVTIHRRGHLIYLYRMPPTPQ
jgi:SAM-dependent methyltransferase